MPGLPNRARTLRSIAANVQKWRARRGLTQAGLAERAGIELRFLQRVERAQVNFGVASLVALADALGVRPAELLRDAELTPPARGRPKVVKAVRSRSRAYAAPKQPETLAVAEPAKRRRRSGPA
jgi:transcriptional regulator with XRE-family HTH domain